MSTIDDDGAAAVASPATPTLRFVCSYGGYFITNPLPVAGGRVHYNGGVSKIVCFDRSLPLVALIGKLAFAFSIPDDKCLDVKCRLPAGGDLFDLATDDDLGFVIKEYDAWVSEQRRSLKIVGKKRTASRLRIFVSVVVRDDDLPPLIDTTPRPAVNHRMDRETERWVEELKDLIVTTSRVETLTLDPAPDKKLGNFGERMNDFEGSAMNGVPNFGIDHQTLTLARDSSTIQESNPISPPSTPSSQSAMQLALAGSKTLTLTECPNTALFSTPLVQQEPLIKELESLSISKTLTLVEDPEPLILSPQTSPGSKVERWIKELEELYWNNGCWPSPPAPPSPPERWVTGLKKQPQSPVSPQSPLPEFLHVAPMRVSQGATHFVCDNWGRLVCYCSAVPNHRFSKDYLVLKPVY